METKATPLQIKADSEGRVEGYASRFGEMDKGGDIVVKGAYTGSLASGRKPKMLWQHDPSQPIGVWDEVKEDETGLFVSGRILDSVEKGREIKSLIEAGAIDGMSIGYRTVKADRGTDGARMLKELDLWEVSMVTFPMLESARASVKMAFKAFEDGESTVFLKRNLEDYLREAGASNTEAKAVASVAVGKLVDMREAGSSLGELTQFMRQFQLG
jgi:HK97 family phage prohead protease